MALTAQVPRHRHARRPGGRERQRRAAQRQALRDPARLRVLHGGLLDDRHRRDPPHDFEAHPSAQAHY